MLLHQRILRFLFGPIERERMEFRECLARAHAEAEDLNRTLAARGGEIADGLKKFKRGNGSYRGGNGSHK